MTVRSLLVINGTASMFAVW